MTEVAKPESQQPDVRRIELDVTGMFCGACVKRIENKLNKLDGVDASVNLGTGIATVEVASDVSVADLCGIIQKAGYGAEQRPVGAQTIDALDGERVDSPLRRLKAAPALMFRMMTSRWRNRNS